jgi:hypothetical protein
MKLFSSISLIILSLSHSVTHSLMSSSHHPPSTRPEFSSKVQFEAGEISAEGLVGKAGGQRSFSYEFCVPQPLPHSATRAVGSSSSVDRSDLGGDEDALEQVLRIDPTIQHYSSSRGRIKCPSDKVLCVAETYGEDRAPWEWKEILHQLSELSFIESFVQSFGE